MAASNYDCVRGRLGMLVGLEIDGGGTTRGTGRRLLVFGAGRAIQVARLRRRLSVRRFVLGGRGGAELVASHLVVAVFGLVVVVVIGIRVVGVGVKGNIGNQGCERLEFADGRKGRDSRVRSRIC